MSPTLYEHLRRMAVARASTRARLLHNREKQGVGEDTLGHLLRRSQQSIERSKQALYASDRLLRKLRMGPGGEQQLDLLHLYD